MITGPGVGPDHCRVTPVAENASAIDRLQFHRHLFAYREAARSIPRGGRVLEIGSGEGYGAAHLAEMAHRVVASDISLMPLRHAASRYPRVAYCCAFGTSLPFPAACFDAVVSFQVIEHVPHVPWYLSEVSRVMRPGGSFFLSTPNRAYRLLPFQRPWNPYHLREYSRRSLASALQPFFDEIRLFGVSGGAQVDALEKARVRQNPVKVYGVMARRGLMRLLKAFQHGAQATAMRTTGRGGMRGSDASAGRPQQGAEAAHQFEVTIDDFHLVADAEQGIDLFAVARRPRQTP